MGEVVRFRGGELSRLSLRTTQGSARWLEPDEAKENGLLDEPGLLFARSSYGVLRYPVKKGASGVGEKHCIVVAPSRSGKGVGFVIPNLLTWPGSAFVIDPKGENAHFTARRRAAFGNVYVLDPCGISGQKARAFFNPLDWLLLSHDFDEDLGHIVEALTPESPGEPRLWNEGGRRLLKGVLLYLIATNDKRKTLGRAYEILNAPESVWRKTIEGMQFCEGNSPTLNRKVRLEAAWYESLHADHKEYHRGTAQFHLSWLGTDSARDMLERSSFDIRELKNGIATVYACIPPLSLEVFEGFTRLLTALSIKAVMLREADREKDLPILFMLDEFATTVGKMGVFDNSFTVIAGYGGRFALILQTIDQLQSLYPERRGVQSWKTVVQNSGLQLYFDAVKDTAAYVSAELGMKTEPVISPIGGSREVQRPLLYPNEVSHPVDEAGRHVKDGIFAFVEGFPPIKSRRLCSFRDPEFVALHNPKDKITRAVPSGVTLYQEALGLAVRDVQSIPGVLEDDKRMRPQVPASLLEASARVSGWEPKAL